MSKAKERGLPKPRPLTDEAGEVRELALADFRRVTPVREVMPGLIDAAAELRRKDGRPKALAPKAHISFRLAADVVASIKASGPGYNVRVEEALRAAGFGGDDESRAASGKVAAKKGITAKKRRLTEARASLRKRRA